MKKLFILIILYVSSVHCQTYYMNVKLKNGSRVAIPMQEIQKLTLTGMPTGIEEKGLVSVVKTFNLLQNYPNPFNPNTTIEYELPSAGFVQVKIYSITGQLILILQNEFLNAGIHKTVWDGKNSSGQTVSSGMYFYQVHFGNSILVKRMLFLK